MTLSLCCIVTCRSANHGPVLKVNPRGFLFSSSAFTHSSESRNLFSWRRADS
jgi:hypothetical protein